MISSLKDKALKKLADIARLAKRINMFSKRSLVNLISGQNRTHIKRLELGILFISLQAV